MKKYLLIPIALVAIFLTGCESQAESNPKPESDGSQSFKDDGSTVPVDRNVYLLKGEVIGEVNETTRQVAPAEGSVTGSQYGTYGSLSGSFTGAITDGKGFVRIRIQSIDPQWAYAPPGDVVIVKTTDTKAKALLNGDIVTFKCRAQYENIGAVVENEKFDEDKLSTWELDLCRLATPTIEVKPDPETENK